jgi:lysylphosphatidylglycerol synthetase-like protein (DUF2156 family)
MTAEEHNKTLATLYFVYGGIHGLTLIALLLLVFAVQTATNANNLIQPAWLAWGGVVFAVLVLIVGLLPLLVGFGFKQKRRWVKPIGVALAIVSMINIPIGTALGIYTLKFFRSEGGIRLYGGKTSSAGEGELQAAMQGTKPLMNWAKRVK